MTELNRVIEIIKRINLYESTQQEYTADCSREIEALQKVLAEIEIKFADLSAIRGEKRYKNE